jgi:hypothetical protein
MTLNNLVWCCITLSVGFSALLLPILLVLVPAQLGVWDMAPALFDNLLGTAGLIGAVGYSVSVLGLVVLRRRRQERAEVSNV